MVGNAKNGYKGNFFIQFSFSFASWTEVKEEVPSTRLHQPTFRSVYYCVLSP